MKIWRNHDDVRKTVKQLVYWQNNHHTVPPILIDAVKNILRYSTKGQILLFFNELQIKAPDLLHLFSDLE